MDCNLVCLIRLMERTGAEEGKLDAASFRQAAMARFPGQAVVFLKENPDEFRVAFQDSDTSFEFLTDLVEAIYPHRMRATLRPSPPTADRSSWSAEAARLRTLHLDETDWLTLEGFPDEPLQRQLNGLGRTIQKIREGWTRKQRNLVHAMRELKVQRHVAQRFGVTPPAVNHVLGAANYTKLLEAEKTLKEGLRQLTNLSKALVAIPKESTPTALHQLPPGAFNFVGREEELAELERDAERGGVVGIRGQGGIGKTALAIALAHKLAPRYPDAQIYLDLRGTHTKEPLSTAAALSHVIHAFMPSAKLPEDEDGVRALFLSVLAGKRALLVMDNAYDAAQVEPLLPPRESLLIVTTRQRFTVGGLPLRELGVLKPAQAEDLLRRLSPVAGPHAAAIAQQCGGLPLALHLAAGILQTPGAPQPAEYAAQLAAARGSQRLSLLKPLPTEAKPELAAVFRLSYHLIKPELQVAWRKLATFPAPFDLTAAAATWYVERETARNIMQVLAAYSLIEYDSGMQRFRMHDLLRDFADSLLSDAERQEASKAHARHYLEVARAADQFYLKGGRGVLSGLSLFDAEWPNIQAGQAWAAANPTDPQAAQLCNDYPDASIYCLTLRLHPLKQIAWFESALFASRRLNLRQTEGNHLGNLGLAYARLGDVSKAIACYQQALAISREIGDRRSEESHLGNLGLAHAVLADTCQAVAYYEQALTISREIGDRRGERNHLGNLGSAYARLDPGKAVPYYEQALAISREIGDRRGEAQALGGLASTRYKMGDALGAIPYFEQALAISREIGDRRSEESHLGNLGLAHAVAPTPR